MKLSLRKRFYLAFPSRKWDLPCWRWWRAWARAACPSLTVMSGAGPTSHHAGHLSTSATCTACLPSFFYSETSSFQGGYFGTLHLHRGTCSPLSLSVKRKCFLICAMLPANYIVHTPFTCLPLHTHTHTSLLSCLFQNFPNSGARHTRTA